MIEYRYQQDEYLHMNKIVLLRLIGMNVTYGIRNGIHLTVTLSFGPFEPSIGFSIWNKVLQ